MFTKNSHGGHWRPKSFRNKKSNVPRQIIFMYNNYTSQHFLGVKIYFIHDFQKTGEMFYIFSVKTIVINSAADKNYYFPSVFIL